MSADNNTDLNEAELINLLDWRIVGEDEDKFVLDAGFRTMLSWPKSKLPGHMAGDFILAGHHSDAVTEERHRQFHRRAERIADIIRNKEHVPVTLKEIRETGEGPRVVLSNPDWDDFTLMARPNSAGHRPLSEYDFHRLLRGDKVDMICNSRINSPSEISTDTILYFASVSEPQPLPGEIYDCVVTNVRPFGFFVNSHGWDGKVMGDAFPKNIADNLKEHFARGTFLQLRCLASIQDMGENTMFAFGPIESESQLRKGDILPGTINTFDPRHVTFSVDIAGIANAPAFVTSSLNAWTWKLNGFLKPGDAVRVLVSWVRTDDCNVKDAPKYGLEILPPDDRDVFGLERGQCITARLKPDDRILEFDVNGRHYSLYNTMRDSLYPQFMSKFDLKGSHKFIGHVVTPYAGEGKYYDPQIQLNILTEMWKGLSDGDLIKARVMSVRDMTMLVQTEEGYWITIPVNNYIHKYRTLRAPEVNDILTLQADTVRHLFQSLYDYAEIEYREVPEGKYQGKAVEYYRDYRLVVEVPGFGKVTALPRCPDYIVQYFVPRGYDLDVTVAPDGKASYDIHGIRYVMPFTSEPVEVEVLEQIGQMLVVRIPLMEGEAYGCLLRAHLEWLCAEMVDMEPYIGQRLMVKVYANKKDSGILVSRKLMVQNPYMSKDFHIGDIVKATVIKSGIPGMVMVEADGVKGMVRSDRSCCFFTPSGTSARYIGETFDTRVVLFTNAKGRLALEDAAMVRNDFSRSYVRIRQVLELTVLGYNDAGEVIVENGNLRGSLSRTSSRLAKYWVNERHFKPGDKLTGAVLSIDNRHPNHQTIVFDAFATIFHDTVRKLNYGSIYEATVDEVNEDGVVLTIESEGVKCPVFLPAMLAAERGEAYHESLYSPGEKVDVRVLYLEKTDLLFYACLSDSEIYKASQHAHKNGDLFMQGTVTAFDPESGYVISLENGTVGYADTRSVSYNYWKTEVLPIGETMEFRLRIFDFKRLGWQVLPTAMQGSGDPWRSLDLKPGNKVTATVAGYYEDDVIITYNGVRDVIDRRYMADLAGKPWDPDYKIDPEDFPIGKELKLTVEARNFSNRHNRLAPDRTEEIKELKDSIQRAVVRHAGTNLVYVELPDARNIIAVMPGRGMAYMPISRPADFFKPGDEIMVKVTGPDKLGRHPGVARNVLLANPGNFNPSRNSVQATVTAVGSREARLQADGFEFFVPLEDLPANLKPGQILKPAPQILKDTLSKKRDNDNDNDDNNDDDDQ